MNQVIFLVVNWNRREKLRRCLFSLKAHLGGLNYRVLVVDNSSTDGSLEMLARDFRWVWVVRNRENLGFARACNRGIAFLRQKDVPFDYLVLLNNDVELMDGSLAGLFPWMDAERRVAGALPAILNEKGRPQAGVGGFRLSLFSAFSHFFFLAAFFPGLFRGLFFNQAYYYKRQKTLELDWLSGVCLVIRREALDAVGGLSEAFFMYAEDLALSEKLKREGKLVYYPPARVYHLQEKIERRPFPTLWLDSLFAYYCSGQKRGRIPGKKGVMGRAFLFQLKVFLLKLVFFSGFLLRLGGYAGLSLFARNDYSSKRKEMAIYAAFILRKIFSRCPRNGSAGIFSRPNHGDE